MLFAHINHPATYEAFLVSPAWKKALDFLKHEAASKPDGEYEIQGRDIYVPISTISTKPFEECVFEAHHEYIDIHYCIEGGETIAWAPVDTLKPTMEFDATKDYCFYESPAHPLTLNLTPGTFAIFFPADAHMPKISDGKNQTVKKAVVKINVKLIHTGK